jgi:hypothetical protein
LGGEEMLMGKSPQQIFTILHYDKKKKKKKKKNGTKKKKKKRKELSKEWYLLLLTVSQFQTRDGQLNPLYFPKAQENQSGRQNACTSWGLKKK